MNVIESAFGSNKRKRNLKLTFDELIEMGWDQSTEPFTSSGFDYEYEGTSEDSEGTEYVNWSRRPVATNIEKMLNAWTDEDFERFGVEHAARIAAIDPDCNMDMYTLAKAVLS